MKGKRTDIDFSEHIVIETKQDNLLIYDFRIPETQMNRIIFINTNGILAVTGDFGNWIFCREFHTSSDGYVSDYYWCEKLSISSVQEYSDYSPKDTEERLREKLKEYIEDQKEKDENFKKDDITKYYTECIENVDNELDYTHFAYREYPHGFDLEDAVFCKEIKYRLKIIFDAFDEMCRRLKEENINLENK